MTAKESRLEQLARALHQVLEQLGVTLEAAEATGAEETTQAAEETEAAQPADAARSAPATEALSPTLRRLVEELHGQVSAEGGLAEALHHMEAALAQGQAAALAELRQAQRAILGALDAVRHRVDGRVAEVIGPLAAVRESVGERLSPRVDAVATALSSLGAGQGEIKRAVDAIAASVGPELADTLGELSANESRRHVTLAGQLDEVTQRLQKIREQVAGLEQHVRALTPEEVARGRQEELTGALTGLQGLVGNVEKTLNELTTGELASLLRRVREANEENRTTLALIKQRVDDSGVDLSNLSEKAAEQHTKITRTLTSIEGSATTTATAVTTLAAAEERRAETAGVSLGALLRVEKAVGEGLSQRVDHLVTAVRDASTAASAAARTIDSVPATLGEVRQAVDEVRLQVATVVQAVGDGLSQRVDHIAESVATGLEELQSTKTTLEQARLRVDDAAVSLRELTTEAGPRHEVLLGRLVELGQRSEGTKAAVQDLATTAATQHTQVTKGLESLRSSAATTVAAITSLANAEERRAETAGVSLGALLRVEKAVGEGLSQRVDHLATAVRDASAAARTLDGVPDAIGEVRAKVDEVNVQIATVASAIGDGLSQRVDHIKDATTIAAAHQAEAARALEALRSSVSTATTAVTNLAAAEERRAETAGLSLGALLRVEKAVGEGLSQRVDHLATAVRDASTAARTLDGVPATLGEVRQSVAEVRVQVATVVQAVGDGLSQRVDHIAESVATGLEEFQSTKTTLEQTRLRVDDAAVSLRELTTEAGPRHEVLLGRLGELGQRSEDTKAAVQDLTTTAATQHTQVTKGLESLSSSAATTVAAITSLANAEERRAETAGVSLGALLRVEKAVGEGLSQRVDHLATAVRDASTAARTLDGVPDAISEVRAKVDEVNVQIATVASAIGDGLSQRVDHIKDATTIAAAHHAEAARSLDALRSSVSTATTALQSAAASAGKLDSVQKSVDDVKTKVEQAAANAGKLDSVQKSVDDVKTKVEQATANGAAHHTEAARALEALKSSATATASAITSLANAEERRAETNNLSLGALLRVEREVNLQITTAAATNAGKLEAVQKTVDEVKGKVASLATDNLPDRIVRWIFALPGIIVMILTLIGIPLGYVGYGKAIDILSSLQSTFTGKDQKREEFACNQVKDDITNLTNIKNSLDKLNSELTTKLIALKDAGVCRPPPRSTGKGPIKRVQTAQATSEKTTNSFLCWNWNWVMPQCQPPASTTALPPVESAPSTTAPRQMTPAR